MRMTLADVLAHQAKFSPKPPKATADACEKESALRTVILDYCKSQNPQWQCIWARSDMKSTLPIGVHDMTIFADKGRVICLELKSRTSKPSREQLGWALQLEMLGHKVHFIRSFAEFMEVINAQP